MNQAQKKMVAVCRETFDRIAIDMLAEMPGQSMTAKDAQDFTGDYVEAAGWWELSYEEQGECLAAAIPEDVCM